MNIIRILFTLNNTDDGSNINIVKGVKGSFNLNTVYTC